MENLTELVVLIVLLGKLLDTLVTLSQQGRTQKTTRFSWKEWFSTHIGKVLLDHTQKLSEDAANRPHVNFVRILALGQYHFRSSIPPCHNFFSELPSFRFVYFGIDFQKSL